MSAKRRAPIDPRWDRTPGGLFVPRRPAFPTRRFIQKLGTAKDCCTPPGCTYCEDGTTADLLVSIACTYNMGYYGGSFDDTFSLSGGGGPGGGGWDGSFWIPGGLAMPQLYLSAAFHCAADWVSIVLTAFIRTNPAGNWIVDASAGYGYDGSGAPVHHTYSTPGVGECVDRYITDHGDTIALSSTYVRLPSFTTSWSDPITVGLDA
jgi:hypothetical protein